MKPGATQDGARTEAGGEARQEFQKLNALRVDASRVYYVREMYIRKDVVRISFTEGKLAFLQEAGGRITGAVFTGTGRAIAVPRDAVERRSLAWFTGTPLLDQPFLRAYLRFTDNTAEELLAQIRAAGVQPLADETFAQDWDPTVANLNPWHSLRILCDRLSAEPQPYFYAGLVGSKVGAFDVLVDDRRDEQVLIGQPRWREGVEYYDVWAAFVRQNAPEYAPGFVPLSYAIRTSILPDATLEGETRLRLRAARAGERMIPVQLSRFLRVQSVETSAGQALEFFQNEAMNREEIAERGDDSLFVVLPAPPRAGDEIELLVKYQGAVISDAGNGVFYVGERGSWYPNLGQAGFATFDLSFRWPRKLMLVATGTRTEFHDEGETLTGRWQTDAPVPVAGFNLGFYSAETVDGGKFKVEVYANQQLEQALQARFRRYSVVAAGTQPLPIWPTPPRTGPVILNEPPPPPSPGLLLKSLGQDVTDSIRYYEKYCGHAFPFSSLAVSPIPGGFGQGWPGLLYLSTLSFLPRDAQSRVGVGQRTQEQITELLPFHEVAHQWWGNVVGHGSYRDQWIPEGLASYLSLLYAESRHNDDKFMTTWLGRYLDDLTTKVPGSDETAESIGPLALGTRLRSSKTPGAYELILYGKGPWIFHMLRMMMRDPKAKNPDARFQGLLSDLLETYRHRALTTQEFQRAVEKHMTPQMDLESNHSMDWFFEQWVRGTGIPHYSVAFEVKPQGDKFLVKGVLKQDGVPATFTAAVPLFAPRAAGKPSQVATVVTTGAETAFQFTTRSRPRRLLVDPNFTLLRTTE